MSTCLVWQPCGLGLVPLRRRAALLTRSLPFGRVDGTRALLMSRLVSDLASCSRAPGVAGASRGALSRPRQPPVFGSVFARYVYYMDPWAA
ncbi:uncharacterized protein MAM_07392 [Metarhizium album ARSEF 1941]|uniref:Uncharacterized protein n=1 Tax=Metarhizium album (strain ARSEF 1941) TaxID=1081103 RepID=A0A0B2WFT1_METAS|nr:uncharacterized protein MAM_07392 [Metarhizium album ARSEF 1941]KHN94796.1 hypothetical protein MAM_07392 [Metarhizium album ARSEF 1941]